MNLQINERAFSDLAEIKIYFKQFFADDAFIKLENSFYEEFDKLIYFPQMGAKVYLRITGL